MMRYDRHNLILDIISNNDVRTQQELCQKLKDAGHEVTQATISRDIREMNIIKSLTPDGKQKYVVSSTTGTGPISDRFVRIFKSTILKIQKSGNIVLVKTLSGCGPAAGEAIDSLYIEHIIGSVAGDNTVLLVADKEENVSKIVTMFEDMLK